MNNQGAGVTYVWPCPARRSQPQTPSAAVGGWGWGPLHSASMLGLRRSPGLSGPCAESGLKPQPPKQQQLRSGSGSTTCIPYHVISSHGKDGVVDGLAHRLDGPCRHVRNKSAPGEATRRLQWGGRQAGSCLPCLPCRAQQPRVPQPVTLQQRKRLQILNVVSSRAPAAINWHDGDVLLTFCRSSSAAAPL